MTTENQRRIFISYSRVDKEFAIKLAQALKSAMFPVWLDQFDIPTGARWDNELEKALNECGIFLVILTPDSIASENVKDEIGYAIDSHKRILPVLLKNCAVPLRLRRFQYVDFTTKSYDEGVESAKQLLTIFNNETVQAMPREEILASAQTRNAQAKDESLATQKITADGSAKEVAKLKFTPTTSGKKTSNKGILIGAVIGIVTIAVIVMCIAGISLWGPTIAANFKPVVASPATKPPIVTNPITVTPVISDPITETPVNTALGPSALNASDAKRFYDKNTATRLLGIAKQQNGNITNFQQIPVTLNNLSPVWIGYNWCATTRDILDNNLKYVKSSALINGQSVPESKFAVAYTTVDASLGDPLVECALIFIVIDNWTTGKHTVNADFSLTQSVFDGVSNQETSSHFFGYIITVP
jgi:hypothetical protein